MNKLGPIVLAVSLLLNAALAVTLVVGASRKPNASKASPAKIAAPSRSAAPAIDETVWPSLNSSDMPTLVNRLREAGFPPEVVRGIVGAQLQEQFAVRRKAIDPGADNRPFWKSATLDQRTTAALRQLSREQQQAFRDLLGPDAEHEDPMGRARDARQFGHLSPDKASEARRVVREFNDLRSDLYMSFGGPVTLTPADREKLTAIDKQMQAELAKLMTPQEYLDYQLRGSNTASGLRYQLAAFDATEAEFRTLFQLQREFDERFGQMYAPPSQEEMRLRGEAHRQLTEQMKAALGPARAKDYERATDYEYRTMSQLVARLELPPETTTKVWEIRDDIQRRANSLRMDPSLSPDQRAQQLAALQKEGIDRVGPLFGGERGVEAYRQYGGQWLNNLVPRPREPTRTAR